LPPRRVFPTISPSVFRRWKELTWCVLLQPIDRNVQLIMYYSLQNGNEMLPLWCAAIVSSAHEVYQLCMSALYLIYLARRKLCRSKQRNDEQSVRHVVSLDMSKSMSLSDPSEYTSIASLPGFCSTTYISNIRHSRMVYSGRCQNLSFISDH
jgi:hypothetical protein